MRHFSLTSKSKNEEKFCKISANLVKLQMTASSKILTILAWQPKEKHAREGCLASATLNPVIKIFACN